MNEWAQPAQGINSKKIYRTNIVVTFFKRLNEFVNNRALCSRSTSAGLTNLWASAPQFGALATYLSQVSFSISQLFFSSDFDPVLDILGLRDGSNKPNIPSGNGRLKTRSKKNYQINNNG